MARDRPNDQYIYLVFARHTRELVIAPGAESATQKQRTSLELVRDINTITNSSRDTIITRYLLSRDILIVFQGVPEKQK